MSEIKHFCDKNGEHESFMIVDLNELSNIIDKYRESEES